MGETTEIEWADATWNPWRGCDKVSPGCAHCYMFDGQRRYGNDPSVVVRAAPGTFEAPLSPKFNKQRYEILKAENRRMRVFTCSWSDWFHEDADGWRERAWEIIRACPDMDFLILTKRPERIAENLPTDWGIGYPNVWLGTSIENRRYVGRADVLREIPAAVRFISAEPLLGPLVYDDAVPMPPSFSSGPYTEAMKEPDENYRPPEKNAWKDRADLPALNLNGIDWLIVGGESGPKHRPMDLQWVRDLRDACSERVPTPTFGGDTSMKPGEKTTAFFYKQQGGRTPKANGRELDGRTWDEMPKGRA